jgi:hypothetical protein
MTVAAGEIEQHAKIETLPDEILLEIFDWVRLPQAARAPTEFECNICDHLVLYPSSRSSSNWCSWKWVQLVHVCRRWRSLVFASPRRLNLLLIYTYSRKARVMKKALATWPTLPIALWYPCHFGTEPFLIRKDQNNLSSALQYPNRIREIDLCLTRSKVGAQLLTSFPALECLRLESRSPIGSPPTLPAGFLGSSAPKLRHIHLIDVAFPTFPLLLSSARDLVSLCLVSRSADISPETLSISLSTTTRLKSLLIDFHRFVSNIFSKTGNAPAILPALTEFYFAGDSAYLEDLLSRIDSPVLERLFKPSAFGARRLSQFTYSPNSPRYMPTPSHWSILLLEDRIFFVNQFDPTPKRNRFRFTLQITSGEIDSRGTLPRFIKRLSSLHSNVQRLDIKSFLPLSPWLHPDEMDSSIWVNFFCRLKSVTRLEVAGVFVQIIESVLEQLPEEMGQRLLPSLNDLHVGKCQTPEPFKNFANARSSSGFPLTVHYAESHPTKNPSSQRVALPA